jgi:hypothetical protein
MRREQLSDALSTDDGAASEVERNTDVEWRRGSTLERRGAGRG